MYKEVEEQCDASLYLLLLSLKSIFFKVLVFESRSLKITSWFKFLNCQVDKWEGL